MKQLRNIQCCLTNSSEKWIRFRDFFLFMSSTRKQTKKMRKLCSPIRFTVFAASHWKCTCVYFSMRDWNFFCNCTCRWFPAMSERMQKAYSNYQLQRKKTNICIIVTTIDLCRIWMKMRTFYTVSFIYFCLLLCTVLQPILIMIKHLVVCLNLGLLCRIERIANTKDLFLIPKSKRFALLKFINNQREYAKKWAKSSIKLIGIL